MPRPSACARWSVIVRDLDASDLPLREFARRRGVHPSTLSWWRSRFRREASAGRREPFFTDLAVVEHRPTEKPEAHLVLTLDRYNAALRVERTTDLALLRDLLVALC